MSSLPLFSWVWMTDFFLSDSKCKAHPKIPNVNEECLWSGRQRERGRRDKNVLGTSPPPNGICKTHLCFSFSSLHVLIPCLKIWVSPRHSSCQIIDCLELKGICKRFITLFPSFSFFLICSLFSLILLPLHHLSIRHWSSHKGAKWVNRLLTHFIKQLSTGNQKTLDKRDRGQYPEITSPKTLLWECQQDSGF